MPFKSRAQVAKFSELEKQGKLKKGTTKAWLAETPKGSLPERIHPKKPIKSLSDVRKIAKKKYG